MQLKRYLSLSEILIIAFLLALTSLVVLPFLYMFAVSFSSPSESMAGNFYVWPQVWNDDAYRYLFSSTRFVLAIWNTVKLTAMGTVINLILSVTLSYALSKKFLPGRRGMMMLIFFTMLFGGGLIPTYLLVKWLGLVNSLWALILPGATNAFTVMVMKTFFQGLPESLDEAARIDGAGELKILLHVVIPLSMPIIATFSLFFMVSHWNEFFGAIIYLNDTSKWPIQPLLRQMVLVGSSNISAEAAIDEQLAATLGANVKMAAILIAMAPIVAVYPFLQKYFAKGALVGSVKE
ncbi:carbohydrate ABC transporter permease [Paenibacillus roseipurpureus]|uniref:Carbohydrate ABC transporter permease n=1 Tax=Paenibacillus roseopurpureus TaxID=2918901 RepID=A0AA96RNY9_9BACL|nr:carbohydrate ABC transporter permease [Paenibacillus sp. MBLB1832]WNR46072.1 carbohydrate ABC transporter permease [Paenibacillus sp. MBLB1832]